MDFGNSKRPAPTPQSDNGYHPASSNRGEADIATSRNKSGFHRQKSAWEVESDSTLRSLTQDFGGLTVMVGHVFLGLLLDALRSNLRFVHLGFSSGNLHQ